MIDPKELRIGNLVFIPHMTTQVTVMMFADGYNYDKFNPIPITTEWLEKLGFERHYKNENITHWVKFSAKHLSFVVTEISSLFGFEYKAHGTEHSPQLLHIHQLQNLYFALTGQELTIKE